MERALTAEEKIRRAEEIYERRKNQNYRNTTATVNVSGNNRDYKLFKKMIIQVLICLLIYFIYYLIQTTNYVVSATTLNKTKEILDYDMDVKGIYTEIKNNFINNENQINVNEENTNNIENQNAVIEENEIQNNNTIESDIDSNINSNTDNNIENNTDNNTDNNIDNQLENDIQNQIENKEEANVEETITLSQELLNNYSIIKPADGFISSEFGTREEEGDVVTPYHNGIDIGVIVGTDVLSAIDGEVILATESSSYGKYVKIQNGDLITVYAHCNELLVNVGDTVNQGDKIAISGSTGNVTRTSFTF